MTPRAIRRHSRTRPPLPPNPPTPSTAAPLLQHLDEYLTLVGNVYYAHSEAGSNSAQFALIRRTTLGLLTSPVREPAVIGA